ncbi:hypothetical protein M8J76_002779 [Diaphorina citri]|nr:hypothetical protein M8J76_002779 [Diaphorina citri]
MKIGECLRVKTVKSFPWFGRVVLRTTKLKCWLYDLTNSYDLAFYLSGIFIGVSGILLVLPSSSCDKDKDQSPAPPRNKTAISPSQSTNATQSTLQSSLSA